MKLELKHLAPYLPYKLKIFIEYDSEFDTNGFDPEFDKDQILISGIREMTGINYENSFLPDCIMFKQVPKTNQSRDGYVQLENIKPILLPLSDLTKEIEVNGERFVPLHRLFWIGYGKKDEDIPKIVKYLTSFKIDRWMYGMRIMIIDKKHGSVIHELIYSSNRFKYFYSTSIYTENKKMLSFRKFNWLNYTSLHVVDYELTDKLFEWHFDVFKLIEAGLAIDINTLQNE